MAHGATLGELCVRFNPAALNINEKQTVLFGLLEGLIRRVDKYPITVPRNLFNDDEDMNAQIVPPTPPPLPPVPPISPSTVPIQAPILSCSLGKLVSSSPLQTTFVHSANSTIKNGCVVVSATKRGQATRPLPRGERFNNRIHNQNYYYQSQQSFEHQKKHQQCPSNHTTNFQPQNSHQSNGQAQNHHQQQYYYNGLKPWDEICCSRGISSQQLEMQMARDRHVIVLLK